MFTWRKVACLTQLPSMWKLNALSRPTQLGQGLGPFLACVCLQEVLTLFCADQHVQWTLMCPGSGTPESCFFGCSKLKTARPLISDPSGIGVASAPVHFLAFQLCKMALLIPHLFPTKAVCHIWPCGMFCLRSPTQLRAETTAGEARTALCSSLAAGKTNHLASGPSDPLPKK